MKMWIVAIGLLILSYQAWAADGSYTITTASTGDLDYQENTVQFFATRLGITATASLQMMCNAGILPFFQQRTQIDAAAAAQAFQQATPEDAATVCTVFCTYGYTCPGFTCP